MSATPIPRTLALILYGDLDISIIDELPKGRQKIDTFFIPPSKRERAFGFIKQHLDEGRQAYIVCPMIENGEQEVANVTGYAQRLREGVFAGYTLGVLHGKMKAEEKEQVMRAFQTGETQLLVATTVVEVGVDVPNAVIMMIENAEMFGLSQLHQLRGRVGRGEHKSSCILVSGLKTEENLSRLGTMCSTSDGFAIAEQDLKQRGPGGLFRQAAARSARLQNRRHGGGPFGAQGDPAARAGDCFTGPGACRARAQGTARPGVRPAARCAHGVKFPLDSGWQT